MKTSLRLLALIGLLWLGCLIGQQVIRPAVMLDAIVPPDLLRQTTPEQRTYMVQRLQMSYKPRFLSWIGAVAVIVLSSFALRDMTDHKS
jgi:hypothetical protein